MNLKELCQLQSSTIFTNIRYNSYQSSIAARKHTMLRSPLSPQNITARAFNRYRLECYMTYINTLNSSHISTRFAFAYYHLSEFCATQLISFRSPPSSYPWSLVRKRSRKVAQPYIKQRIAKRCRTFGE